MSAHNYNDPIKVQESFYSLPYHWFPEYRLKKVEREIKKEIILNLLGRFSAIPIHEYLDVGCGDGKWTVDIYNHFKNIHLKATGIDISERAIGFAKIISPFIDFKSYSGEEFPVPSNTYDVVTCIEVIEHVPDEREKKFVEELYRVTKPGGGILLTTPSTHEDVSPHHFRHYSVKQLKHLFADVGFTKIVFSGQSMRLHPRLKWIRNWSNHLPFVWMMWRFSYRERAPQDASNLFLIAEKDFSH